MTEKRLKVTRPVRDKHNLMVYVDTDGSLDSVIEQLQTFKKEYPDRKLYIEKHWIDEYDDELFLYEERLETDEEMKTRLDRLKLQEDHERAQYKRLRAKYGDKQ